MSDKERRAVKERLAAIPDREERLVLATGRYIGEGFDDARLDTLFLALPISWKGTLIQYTGRLHRLHPTKAEVQIFDYVDRSVPMLLRMFEKRLRGYRAIGYARGEAPLGFEEEPEDIVAEYDQRFCAPSKSRTSEEGPQAQREGGTKRQSAATQGSAIPSLHPLNAGAFHYRARKHQQYRGAERDRTVGLLSAIQMSFE